LKTTFIRHRCCSRRKRGVCLPTSLHVCKQTESERSKAPLLRRRTSGWVLSSLRAVNKTRAMETEREPGRGRGMGETKAREDRLQTTMEWLGNVACAKKNISAISTSDPLLPHPTIGHVLFLDKARVLVRGNPVSVVEGNPVTHPGIDRACNSRARCVARSAKLSKVWDDCPSDTCSPSGRLRSGPVALDQGRMLTSTASRTDLT
jgi:hypothetical protein